MHASLTRRFSRQGRIEMVNWKTLLSNLSRNTGYYWFRGSGPTYQAYLVPWLPGVDYADDVAGYGQ